VAYYSKLLAISGDADGDRPDLRDAHTVLARESNSLAITHRCPLLRF